MERLTARRAGSHPGCAAATYAAPAFLHRGNGYTGHTATVPTTRPQNAYAADEPIRDVSGIKLIIGQYPPMTAS